jgi:predicted transcriptional regulator
MSAVRVKFATQVDAELLESVRQLAKSEGRQIQAVVEDALRQHLEARQAHSPPGPRACNGSIPQEY